MFFKPQFDIDAAQAKTNLDTGDICLLDVRSVAEFQEGHIENAMCIPVEELEERHQELNKESTIYLYCRSGQRANSAKKMLLKLGFHMVYNIGGVVQWPYELTK